MANYTDASVRSGTATAWLKILLADIGTTLKSVDRGESHIPDELVTRLRISHKRGTQVAEDISEAVRESLNTIDKKIVFEFGERPDGE